MSQGRKADLNAYRKIDAALERSVLELLDWILGAWPGELWRRAFSRDGEFVVMQLDFDIAGFDPWKLQTGCYGLRVRIFTQVHPGKLSGLCENYGEIGEKSTVGCGPWPEDLVWRLVWIVLREVFSRILLGESSFEAFERVGVEKVVWVVGFARWVVWHWPAGGGGGRRRGGSLHVVGKVVGGERGGGGLYIRDEGCMSLEVDSR